MNLSFRQLQTFVEVMRTGSISEAGRILGRTQPAVSAAIAGLEKEIGFPLFERERKRLVAKPEAYYFQEEAEFLLEHLTRSTRTLQDIGNLDRGKLKVACNPAASIYFMPTILGRFLKDKPHIKASLMVQSSPVITDWVASQQYDVGVAEAPEARRTIDIKTFALPCFCAMPKDSSLARKSKITPADLSGRPMALLFDEHQITIETRKAFQNSGAQLNQRFELRTFLPALQLVSQGLCFAICESLSAASHEQSSGDQSGIVFRPFETNIEFKMSLLTPANRPLSMVAERFASELQEELQSLVTYRPKD